MSEDFRRRLSSTRFEEVNDEMLDRWDAAEPDALEYRISIPSKEPDDPFDLEVAKPRAIGIERLYHLFGKKVPAQITASLGANVPVLLAHGMTPFYKPGRTPTGVWGMGYRCELAGERSATVAFFPASRKYDVIHVSQQISFGIKAGGEIGIPEGQGLVFAAGAAAIELSGASLRATTDQEFAVAAQCMFSVLEVQAGPVGAGGARWNLYRGRDSIETNQALFHTILVPRGTEHLDFTIETWIRRSGRFFGLQRVRQWTYPSETFQVSLEGLSD